MNFSEFFISVVIIEWPFTLKLFTSEKSIVKALFKTMERAIAVKRQ